MVNLDFKKGLMWIVFLFCTASLFADSLPTQNQEIVKNNSNFIKMNIKKMLSILFGGLLAVL